MSNFMINNDSGGLDKNLSNLSVKGQTVIENIAANYISGAVVSGVSSVNTLTGNVTMTTDNIGEGNNKYVSSAQKTLINNAIQSSEKGAASGVVPLNSQSKIDSQFLNITTSGLKYNGLYNAFDNIPVISTTSNASDTEDSYYIVSMAGDHPSISGLQGLSVGDQVFHAFASNTWSHIDLSINSASESYSGTVYLAQQAEVNTGTNALKAITPATLSAYTGITNKVLSSSLGASSGVATLDSNQKLTSSQKPDYNLNDLIDVNTSGAVYGAYLSYDGSGWTPHVDTHTLESLTDVQISSSANNQALIYNSTASKWENQAIPRALNELSNVSIITPVNSSQVLKFTGVGNNSTNTQLSLDDLGDVSISAVSDGDYITYNAFSQQFINTPAPTIPTVNNASETVAGVAELATQTETDTGTDDTRIITPLKLKNYSKWSTKIDNSLIGQTNGIATLTEGLLTNTQKPVYNLTEMSDTLIGVPANSQILQYNGTKWINANAPTSGEVNTASNVGTGGGQVYRSKTGVNFDLKTIKAGSNITITNNSDDISIAATTSSTSAYLGGWNSSSNTPTLVNGTGTAGTWYTSTVQAISTQPIATFWNVGDSIFYTGTSWQKMALASPTSAANIGAGTGVIYTGLTNGVMQLKTFASSSTCTVVNGASSISFDVTGFLAATITTPLANQVIMRSPGNTAWINAYAEILKCGDYALSGTLSNNDILRYNSTTSKFNNSQSLTTLENNVYAYAFNVASQSNTGTLTADYSTANEQTTVPLCFIGSTTGVYYPYANIVILAPNIPTYTAPGTPGDSGYTLVPYSSRVPRSFLFDVNNTRGLSTPSGNTGSQVIMKDREIYALNSPFGSTCFSYDFGVPICPNAFVFRVDSLFSDSNNWGPISIRASNSPITVFTRPMGLVDFSGTAGTLLLNRTTVQSYYYLNSLASNTISFTNTAFYRYFKIEISSQHFSPATYSQNAYVITAALQCPQYTYSPLYNSLSHFTITRSATTGDPIITINNSLINIENTVTVDYSRLLAWVGYGDVVSVIRSGDQLRIANNNDNTNYIEITSTKGPRFYGNSTLWGTVRAISYGSVNNFPAENVPTNVSTISVFKYSPFNVTKFVQTVVTLPTSYKSQSTFYIRIRLLSNTNTAISSVSPSITLLFEPLGGVMSSEYTVGVTPLSIPINSAGQTYFIDSPVSPNISIFTSCTLHILIIAQSAGYTNNSLYFLGCDVLYELDSIASDTIYSKS